MASLLLLDTLEHDTSYSTWNALAKIDSTHFVLAYQSASYEMYVKTFSIDGSGNITEIDSLNHATSDSLSGGCSVVVIDSTHFIVAWTGAGNDGYITTFSMDANKDNITKIHELEHDGNTSRLNSGSLVMVDSTHFALAYAGPGLDGYLRTFSIDGSYNISVIDRIEHDLVNSNSHSLLLIDSTHLFLAHKGGSGYYVKTFSLDGSYIPSQIDELNHAADVGASTTAYMIDSTHFISTYQDNADDGIAKTFSIDGSYDNITEIDSGFEFNSTYSVQFALIQIDSSNYLVIDGGNSTADLLTIDGSYNISETSIDTNEATFSGSDGHAIALDSTHIIVAYRGADDDGYIQSLEWSDGNIDTIDGVSFGDIDSIDGVDVDDIDEIDGVST